MKRNLCSNVMMEEGYMRMSIEYNNDTSKLQIQEAISKVEKNMGLYPSVIRRAISADAGNFSVEFESAGITREAGDFCENVMKELGIKHCEV